jgi:hypothetical protein
VRGDLLALESQRDVAPALDDDLLRAWSFVERQAPADLRGDVSLLMALTATPIDSDREPAGRVRTYLAEEPAASSAGRLDAYLASVTCEAQ